MLKTYHCKIYFVFPEQTKKEWLTELEHDYQVTYTRKPYNNATSDFAKLFREKNINLVHTHFEGYDVPVAKAVKKVNKNIKMVGIYMTISQFIRKICHIHYLEL